MTETSDRRRVGEIARSLNQYAWRPTRDEVQCGAGFFQLVKGMEEAQRPELPRDATAKPWPRLLRTENVLVLGEEVALLQEEFLPEWRARLPDGSPMTELIELYVQGAEPVVRHTEAVWAAWESAVLPEPAEKDIAWQARYSGTPAAEVTARLRYEIAARWEEEPDRRSLWGAMEPAWNYLGGVRSTMMAAVSGDVEY
ncbi:hypothetical protein AB0D14_36095 [Streptomyces sp. NPDC048484]|uniref:hypothetical protein n=1 Tax=Streptomyces sp. NPDC048484 TaxID=3155146 RepID=UPI0034295281